MINPLFPCSILFSSFFVNNNNISTYRVTNLLAIADKLVIIFSRLLVKPLSCSGSRILVRCRILISSGFKRHSGACLDPRARRGPSASHRVRTTRFNEASLGRSLEPKRRASWASARLNPTSQTKLWILVWFNSDLVGPIKSTKSNSKH